MQKPILFDQTLSNNIIEYIIGILFFALVFVTTLGVFFRYVMNDALSWTMELARYLMVWITLFGASAGAKRNLHLKLAVNLFSLFSAKKVFLVKIFLNLCTISFLVVMAYKGIQYCLITNMYISPALKVPMGYIWGVVPLNAILMSFFIIRSTVTELISLLRRNENL